MNNVERRIARAREWVALEVPFIHLGRNEHGSDCVGLLLHAMEHPTYTAPAYPRDPYKGQLEQQLDRAFGGPVAVLGREGADPATLLPGDVLALAYGLPARHIGIVAEHPAYPGYLSLIHTDSTVGRVTEHLLDDQWAKRIRRVYRP